MASMSEQKKPGRRPNPDSKRSQGGSRHKTPRKVFHGPQELFDALTAYIEATRPQPTDSAVLRVALEEFLASKGFWPPMEGK